MVANSRLMVTETLLIRLCYLSLLSHLDSDLLPTQYIMAGLPRTQVSWSADGSEETRTKIFEQDKHSQEISA